MGEQENRTIWKERLKWLLFLVVSIWIAYFLLKHQESFSELRRLTFQQMVCVFSFLAFSLFLLGYQFRIMMLFFHIRLSIQEWFGLSMCNAMYNYFLPARGGTWLRAYYLKKKYGFSYIHYTLLFLISFLLMYITAGMVGMAVVGLFMLVTNQSAWDFFILFPGLLLLIIGGTVVLKWLFFLSQGLRFQKIQKYYENIHRGVYLFKNKPKLVLEFLFVRSLILICHGIAYAICLKSLSTETISVLMMTGVMALTSFSALFSLTPGNLGIREMVMGLSCSSLGISLDIALLAACIVRAASIIIVFFFGLIFSRILLHTL